jgi:hypothetical protein
MDQGATFVPSWPAWSKPPGKSTSCSCIHKEAGSYHNPPVPNIPAHMNTTITRVQNREGSCPISMEVPLITYRSLEGDRANTSIPWMLTRLESEHRGRSPAD